MANGSAGTRLHPGRPLFLNGSGVAGNGALENVFGINSVTGAITLNTAATIGVDAGMLTQSGG